MRTPLLTALAVALLTAGCLGASDETTETETTGPDGALLETVHRSTQDEFEAATNGETTTTIPLPNAQAGGLFAEYQLETSSDARLSLAYPNGDTRTLATAATSSQTPTGGTGQASAADWMVLPGPDGREGNLTVTLTGNGTSSYTLNLTLQPPEPLPATNGTSTDGTTVVAIIDTGVNPYHEVFQRPNLTTDKLPDRIHENATGHAPLSLSIDQGEDYVASIRDDASIWSQAPSQRLVHFEGTNVLGYELTNTTLPSLPVLDGSGHGTMTSHSATHENPDGLVVMITGPYDAGVAWAAQQDWIDFISISWGPAANAAGAAEPYATGWTTHQETLQADRAGKITFAATGNDPTLATTDTTSGPPWVHAVSGAHESSHSRAAMSGNLVDTVANWTQTLAVYDTLNETTTASGTSFATPTTAGIASRILHETRQAVNHTGGLTEDDALVHAEGVTVTNSDLREALNRSAIYWEATQYGAEPGSTSLPIVPGAPWLSMGWGYLDGAHVDTAVQGLLGNEPLPEKSDQAQTAMQANLDARQAYWGQLKQQGPSGP